MIALFSSLIKITPRAKIACSVDIFSKYLQFVCAKLFSEALTKRFQLILLVSKNSSDFRECKKIRM